MFSYNDYGEKISEHNYYCLLLPFFTDQIEYIQSGRNILDNKEMQTTII